MTDAQTDLAPLRDWLAGVLPHPVGEVALETFAGGQSNPTFRLKTGGGDYVLRRKPMGVLLPKAHMIEREFQVLGGLAGTPAPVPRVYGLCEDAAVLGSAFYVMQLVEGRIFWDPALPDLAPSERAALYDGMNDAIAKLHSVDVEVAGLSGYGRAEGFVQRQIRTWTAQYRASQTLDIPAMEALIDWLPARAPESGEVAVVHGDFRIDNLIFHPTEPRVIAILDWELSTIGDPIADFAYNVISWRIPSGLFRGLGDLDLAALGVPDEAAYKQAYMDRTGRSALPHWEFYLAFSLFRLAAIIQGIARRALDGTASAANAAETGAKAGPLAQIAWDIARGG
jgi:aminoglycoside phosphotransferase (APT) family kinase protein